MKKIRQIYMRPQRLLRHVALVALLACGACTNDSADCPDETLRDTVYHLQFAVSTHAGSVSRAADISGEVPGSVAENYINVDGGDLQFLLFDGERRFLQELQLTDVELVYMASNYAEYIFHAPVTAQYFKDNISKSEFSFYIMALANGQSMGMTYPVPTPGQTIEQIAAGRQGTNDGGALLTAKPKTTDLVDVGWWAPQCFPMAGLQKFTISGPELQKSTEAIPYNISAGGKDINMLRALAKIEVIDHANFTGPYNESTMGNDHNRIEKVEINGFMNYGAIIPSIVEWTNTDGDETQQVDNPTVPTAAVYQNPPTMRPLQTIKDDLIIDFLPDTHAKEIQPDGCNVFSGYVYEYDMQRVLSGQQVPYIRVTTQGKQSDTDTEGSHVIPMLLAKYTNGVAGEPVASLLRNHIYRFQINAINNDANLTVTWTVCPMDQVVIDIPPFE